MKNLLVSCRECGEAFYTKSKSAKFCGNPCRQKAWRRNNEQKEYSKKYTLTMDEQSFIIGIEELNKEHGEYLWELWTNGDIQTLKQLYEMSQNAVLMDLIGLTSILDTVTEIRVLRLLQEVLS